MIAAPIILSVALSSGWYDRKSEGWFYFEENRKDVEEVAEETNHQSESTASEKLAEIRKELENRLAEAILNPTEENVYSYMALQKTVAARASGFSHQWAKTLLSYPELDATLSGRPVTRYGIKVYNTERNDRIKSLIKELSNKYVIAFFYEGKSRISQAQSTIAIEFSKRYDLHLLPFTVDKTPLEILPKTIPGEALAEKIGINLFPSTYLFNPETSEAIPIAYGIATMDILERNIELQFELEKTNE